MHSFSKLFLAALPFTATVEGGRYWYSRHSRTAARSQPIVKTYMIEDFYQGADFFNDWTFLVGADPTGGNVIYQSQSDAQSKGLAYINPCDNSLILAVDSTSTVAAGGKRASVRIMSEKSYNGGLFIFDASYMPVGCSTWPSFWTVGPNWPVGGEIDVVEGINNQDTNQMTLHTGTNQTCTNEQTNGTHQFTGQIKGSNCHSAKHADSGCGIVDTDTRSFGYGFNNAEGGVFALLWDNSTGMSMWHFPRVDIPADLIAHTPKPSTWGTPAGFWSSQSCDMTTNFYDQKMIIDTTICGEWAGGIAYAQSGCPGTCSDMVANAANYISEFYGMLNQLTSSALRFVVDAKWVINYVAVYQ